MKIKVPKVALTSLVVFSLISILNTFRSFYVHNNKKKSTMIEKSIEEVKNKDIIHKVQKNFNIETKKWGKNVKITKKTSNIGNYY